MLIIVNFVSIDGSPVQWIRHILFHELVVCSLHLSDIVHANKPSIRSDRLVIIDTSLKRMERPSPKSTPFHYLFIV